MSLVLNEREQRIFEAAASNLESPIDGRIVGLRLPIGHKFGDFNLNNVAAALHERQATFERIDYHFEVEPPVVFVTPRHLLNFEREADRSGPIIPPINASSVFGRK